MAENLYDFQFKKTLLQRMPEKTGSINVKVTIERTPICHAELAGEGIEYSWGYAKLIYRGLPSLEKKKGKDNFHKSVRHCLSEGVLSTKRIQKFARRAQR